MRSPVSSLAPRSSSREGLAYGFCHCSLLSCTREAACREQRGVTATCIEHEKTILSSSRPSQMRLWGPLRDENGKAMIRQHIRTRGVSRDGTNLEGTEQARAGTSEHEERGGGWGEQAKHNEKRGGCGVLASVSVAVLATTICVSSAANGPEPCPACKDAVRALRHRRRRRSPRRASSCCNRLDPCRTRRR